MPRSAVLSVVPVLFGFGACESSKVDTSPNCDVVIAPCPDPGEFVEMPACDGGYWALVLQCDTVFESSCVFADELLLQPDMTLHATCDAGFREVRATLCGC